MAPKKKSYFESFPLILLAGGNGTRAGAPKGLIEYNGRPWLEAQLRRFHECGGRRAVVVLGYKREDYQKALPWLDRAHGKWLKHDGMYISALVNMKPEHGQFSSLQCGGRFLSRHKSDGAFVLPIDVPCPAKAVWDGLAAEMNGGVQVCMPEWEGKGGHPVLLSWQFLERLIEVPVEAHDARLDMRIHELPPGEVAGVKVSDASIVMNMNTPEDWKALSWLA